MILCFNRLTGNFNHGTWFYGKQVLDLSRVDLNELYFFSDPEAAARWVVQESAS